MKRIFKEFVTRECTDCKEVVDAKYFTNCKRTNKNEVVYYQRADCKFCRAKKERDRRAKNKKMIHNEAEYQQMLNDQAQYEAETMAQLEYITMLNQNAVEFLTEYYGSNPNDGGPEGQNYITLIMSAFEWMYDKQRKDEVVFRMV